MDGFLSAVAKGELSKAKSLACQGFLGPRKIASLKARRSGKPHRVSGPEEEYDAPLAGTIDGRPIAKNGFHGNIGVGTVYETNELCVNIVSAVPLS